MLTEKIPKGLKNEKINTKINLPKIESPIHLFPLHTLGIFAGARNSGKTNACSLLVKDYMDEGCFTRLFIISPTFTSNPVLQELPVRTEDVYTNSQGVHGSIEDILKKIEKDVEEYKDNTRYKEAYNRYLNKTLTFEDQMLLDKNDFEKPKKTKKPCPVLIIDDMSHTPIYSESRENPFINLLLRHRHIYGVGMSIFMLVQSFKSGIPKVLRQNTQVFFLYRTNDISALESIYEEFGNICSLDQFLELYKSATENDKDFLTIDAFNPDKKKRFRKNFDTILHFNQEESALDSRILKLQNRKRKNSELESENKKQKIE